MPKDKTVMTFNEGIQGRPEALRAWFYPGRNFGDEFVYPKAKAIEIATAAKTPVLFTPREIPLEVVAPIKSADEPVVVQLKQAPIMAIQPNGEQVELAVVVTPPPPEELRLTTSEPLQVPVESLPNTASSLPMIALCGVLLLGGALVLRLTTPV